MTDIRKPVLCIDLGATYTKVAWRPLWPAGNPNYEDSCKPITIRDHTTIPTLVLEKSDGTLFFGDKAAGMKPASGDRLHDRWKSDLFSSNDPKIVQQAAEVAGRFLGWLRKELEEEMGDSVNLDKCRVRVCVPESESHAERISLLAANMEENGWDNAEIFQVSEPLANFIGFLSEGRNWFVDSTKLGLNCVFSEILGQNHPLALAINRNFQGAGQASYNVALIDIGSYTTDLAVIPWNADAATGFIGEISICRSFSHGILEAVDQKVLPELANRHGFRMEDLTFLEREALKETIYGNRILVRETATHGLTEIGGREDQDLLAERMERFIDDLWQNHLQSQLANLKVDWFVLTGGGSLIPRIKRALRLRLMEIGATNIEIAGDRETLIRAASALGGSSAVLDWLDIERGEPIPRDPIELNFRGDLERDGATDCPCSGRNKNCARCSGKGFYVPRRAPSQPVPARISNPPIPVASTVGGPALAEVSSPRRANPPKPVAGASIRDLERLLSVEGPKLLQDHTLHGWMGQLVFPDLRHYRERDNETLALRLLETNTLQGKADWYRLLCLGCALGAPVHRTTLKQFWTENLEKGGFWERTIPTSDQSAGDSDFLRGVDAFFQDLIHREFTSTNAKGEDAELLRRVFYDFRKMHTYVFLNDLPEVFREVVDQSRHHEAPIHFLKSGLLPGNRPWRGVIGQSMTSPLLFLMREFARIGFLDRNIHGPVCYYMNTRARRAAIQLGWLEDRTISRYDFDSVLDASRKVHERMTAEFPDGLDWFDLPLQHLGGTR